MRSMKALTLSGRLPRRRPTGFRAGLAVEADADAVADDEHGDA